MKVSGNDLRTGHVIEHQGKLWTVVRTQHTQPGKGGAFVQIELRNLVDGTKFNTRFRSGEDVERAILDERPMQYLYADGNLLTFMDQETFEQIAVQRSFIGDAVDFLEDGMVVTISFYEGEPVGVQLPETVVCRITEAEPVVKGQTASASYKPATLENGRRIMVPPHIDAGADVVVHTGTGTYQEKAKE